MIKYLKLHGLLANMRQSGVIESPVDSDTSTAGCDQMTRNKWKIIMVKMQ